MANAELLISNENGVYTVKVVGRATFECAPPLRNLAKSLEQANFSAIRVDLADCSGMDSTFMGILAMLGLRAKKINASMAIHSAGELNMSLLCGLGLKKLFSFTDEKIGGSENTWNDSDSDKKSDARMVLDAHKTLMDVDEQNVKKFEKVVDLVQRDLDKLNNPE